MTRHNPNCSHDAPVGCAGVSGASTLDLAPRLYSELRALARGWMRHEAPHHTLSATELAHEAYLRLNDQDDTTWSSRTHFLSVAAIIIRRILVDHARARGAAKRGGGWQRVSLSGSRLLDHESATAGPDVLDLHEALVELRARSPRQERVVELKFFGGMENREIAEALGLSETVVKREWRFARAWLSVRLNGCIE